MWRRGGHGNGTVSCIACGVTVERSDAREYDKHGDRWDRSNKEFEHLCKPCHGDLCHQPRAGLEALLVEVGAGEGASEDFFARYADAVEGSGSEPEHEPER